MPARCVPPSVTALACATMLLFTVAFLRVSPFAPRALYGAIETLVAIVALAAAWLMRRRFLHTGCRCDLLLAAAVLAFCIVHLVTAAVPAALGERPHGYLLTTDIYGEFLVYAVIVAAVFASRAPLLVAARRPNRLLDRDELEHRGRGSRRVVSSSVVSWWTRRRPWERLTVIH